MTFMNNVMSFLSGMSRNVKKTTQQTTTNVKTFYNYTSTNVGKFVDDKKQIYADLKTINEGMKESNKFKDEYQEELKKSGEITRDMKEGGFFKKIGAGFRGLSFTGSKRGKAAIRDGIYLMDKYDPALKRLLDRIGHENFDGGISDEQIRRASKSGGLSEVGNQFKKNPFQMIFHPSQFKAAYREGYKDTVEVLEAYRKYRKFLHSKKFSSRFIRNIARKELKKKYGDDFEFGDMETNDSSREIRRRRVRNRRSGVFGQTKIEREGRKRGFVIYSPKREREKQESAGKETTGSSISIDTSDDM